MSQSGIDLQIGEAMLFILGIGLSIVLLFVLFIPFLSRFHIRTWVQVNRVIDDGFWQKFAYKMRRAGFEVTIQEQSVILAKQVAQFELCLHDDRWIQVTQKNFPLINQSLTIISGTGASWVTLELHKALDQAQYKPEWKNQQSDEDVHAFPMAAKQRWMITVSPWH